MQVEARVRTRDRATLDPGRPMKWRARFSPRLPQGSGARGTLLSIGIPVLAISVPVMFSTEPPARWIGMAACGAAFLVLGWAGRDHGEDGCVPSSYGKEVAGRMGCAGLFVGWIAVGPGVGMMCPVVGGIILLPFYFGILLVVVIFVWMMLFG